jgi:hypothetical protein
MHTPGSAVSFAAHWVSLVQRTHALATQMGSVATLQWASVVHRVQDPAAAPVPMMHAGSAAFLVMHCASLAQAAHAWVATLQMGVVPEQLASVVHMTHEPAPAPVPVMHAGAVVLLVRHCASLAQAAQTCVEVLQMGVVPVQLASTVHWTHVPAPAPVPVMHTGAVVLLVMHCASVAQVVQTCVEVLQMGVAPGQ